MLARTLPITLYRVVSRVRSPLLFGLPFLLTNQYSRCDISRDGNLKAAEGDDYFLSPVEEILREAFVFDLFVRVHFPSFGAAEGPLTYSPDSEQPTARSHVPEKCDC